MFNDELTDFVGANENPLSDGGNWTQSFTTFPPLQRFSNAATDSSHGNPNYSHWTTVFNYDTGGDVWGCTDGGQLGAALETWRVCLWQNVGGSRSDGYEWFYGGGIGKGFTMRKYVGGTISVICAGSGGYPDRIGLRINGADVEGWAMYAGVWSLQCSVSDGTYRGNLYAGLSIEDPTNGGLSFGCFGAGESRRRTQIYRILRGITPEPTST